MVKSTGRTANVNYASKMVLFRKRCLIGKFSLIALTLTCVLAVFASTRLLAEEGDEVRYVSLQPPFIANFGVVEQGSLKYVKAEISIRAILKAEEGEAYIVDLMFTNFVVQR